jgi:hypothetical protein
MEIHNAGYEGALKQLADNLVQSDFLMNIKYLPVKKCVE